MPMNNRSRSSLSEVESQAAELARSCLAVRIRLLSRLVSGIYEKQIRESSLTIGQMNMLAAMINMGPEKASASKLSKVLCMEKSTVSRNLDKMEANGWSRRHEPSYGRLESLSVTPSGRRVFAKTYPGWADAQSAVADELGDELVDAIMRGVAVEAMQTI